MKQKNTSKKSETNWDKLGKMTDAEIDLSDCPEISPEQFARSVVRRGLAEVPRKTQLTLRLDSEVLEWYRSKGRGYQTQINTLLRAYMEACKTTEPRRRV